MTVSPTRTFEAWFPGGAQRMGVFRPTVTGSMQLVQETPCTCGDRIVVRPGFPRGNLTLGHTYNVSVDALQLVVSHPIFLESEFVVPCGGGVVNLTPFNTYDGADLLELQWNTSQDVRFRLNRGWRDRVLYNETYLVRTSYTSNPAAFQPLRARLSLHHPYTDGRDYVRSVAGPADFDVHLAEDAQSLACRSPGALADLTVGGLSTCTFLEGMRHYVAQDPASLRWEFREALDLFALSEAEFAAWFPTLDNSFALWRPSLHRTSQPAPRDGPSVLHESFATVHFTNADRFLAPAPSSPRFGFAFALPGLGEPFWAVARVVDLFNATWHLPLAKFQQHAGADARACALGGVRAPFEFLPPANEEEFPPEDLARAAIDDNCTLNRGAVGDSPGNELGPFETVLVFAEEVGGVRKSLVKQVSFQPDGDTSLQVSFAVQSQYSSYEVTVLSVSETAITATAVVRLLDKKGRLGQLPDQLAITTQTLGGAPGPSAVVVLVESNAALGFRDFTLAVAKEAFVLATLTLRETTGFVAAILTLRFSPADDLSVAVPDLNTTTHLAIVAFPPNATDLRQSAKRYMEEQYLPGLNHTVLLASALESFQVPSALRIPVAMEHDTFCIFAGASELGATLGVRASVANASGTFDVTNPAQEEFAFNPYADADFDTLLRRCYDQALCLDLTRLGRRFQLNATVDAAVAIEQDAACPPSLGSRASLRAASAPSTISLEVVGARAVTPSEAVQQFWIELAHDETLQTSGHLFRFGLGDAELWRSCDMSSAAFLPVAHGESYQLVEEGYYVVPGLLPPGEACRGGRKFYVTRTVHPVSSGCSRSSLAAAVLLLSFIN